MTDTPQSAHKMRWSTAYDIPKRLPTIGLQRQGSPQIGIEAHLIVQTVSHFWSVNYIFYDHLTTGKGYAACSNPVEMLLIASC